MILLLHLNIGKKLSHSAVPEVENIGVVFAGY